MVEQSITPDLKHAVHRIECAILNNPKCSSGLFTQNRVFAVERGPFGGPELLALIYADDSFSDYWYAHLLKSPKNMAISKNINQVPSECEFVSLICWADRLVNAATVPLLFKRFHYWMTVNHSYSCCSVQNDNDAYAEAGCFDDAVGNLEMMVCRFELEKRWGDEDGPYGESPADLRILNVYGLEDCKDENGCYPPVPTQPVLTLVKEDP